MRRLLVILAALGVAVAPAGALADPKKPHPHGGPPGQMKKWSKGERLPATYYTTPRYYITEPARYRLAPPPPGYRWVLVESDAYLVRSDNGLVSDLVANAVASLLR